MLQNSYPPIVFAAQNPKFMGYEPGTQDAVWAVDLKACRHQVQLDVFKEILFVEFSSKKGQQRVAAIYGSESKDAALPQVEKTIAAKQKAFIEFLRSETRKNQQSLGGAAVLFNGSEYSAQGKATAAYIFARQQNLLMGISHLNQANELVIFCVDPEDDNWLETAKNVVAYDEL